MVFSSSGRPDALAPLAGPVGYFRMMVIFPLGTAVPFFFFFSPASDDFPFPPVAIEEIGLLSRSPFSAVLNAVLLRFSFTLG